MLTVPAGADLQAALNSANPGDTITLEAGAVYVGNFVLPNKSGNDYITITGSQVTVAPGTRVTPLEAGRMPKIVTPNGASAVATAAGAHHFRLVGIEIHPADGVYGNDLVALGDASATLTADLAHDLDIDRAYIHGDPAKGSKRGIALNSANTTIENSYISDIKSTFQDSQAICGWNGPGPFTIVNNHLEASGENMLFGGAPPVIPNLIPSDITLRGNYFYKPLSWKQDDPSYAGTLWSVKNLFELKNAQRVLVEGNIFENNWGQSQSGYALVLTVRAEGGMAPWAVVDTVTFRNNIVRHTGGGVDILGKDDLSNNQGQTQNITIQNNLFDDVNDKKWRGSGWLFLFLNGVKNVTIEHNTGLQSTSLIVADEAPSPGLVYQNNITPLFGYGVFISGQGSGVAGLNYYFTPWVFSKNVLPGYANNGQPGYPLHPADNFYPAKLDDVGFVDWTGGNYRLAANSSFKGKGSDGKDPGADMDALLAATQYVISGNTLAPSRRTPVRPVKPRQPVSNSGN